MKVLFFAASTRRDSLNKKLIAVAHSILKQTPEIRTELIQLNDFPLPLYDGDLEQQGLPSKLLALTEYVSSAQAIVISAPEYNAGISGVLKNTIDWLSRVRPSPLEGKSIFLMGASPGALGAVRGLWHTRVPFEALNCHVYPSMLGLPKAHEAFLPSGELKDQAFTQKLSEQLKAFVDHAAGKR